MFNFVAYSPENMPTLKNKPPPLFEKKALLLIALVKIHDHSHISTSLPVLLRSDVSRKVWHKLITTHTYKTRGKKYS